jgi:glycosyltransferase involved in cell wall biosynthesis
MTAPVRIGVDARELLGDATGVGRYLGELMRRWTARADAATRRFLLYAPGPIPLALAAGAVEHRIGGSGRGTWWEQTWLRSAVRADRPDVFFAPAYTAPLGIAVPLAVTIHDLSFMAHPEWFRPREGMRRRWLTARAAAAAAVIFTDSRFSRGEIERYLHVERSRICVIAPGLAPRARSTSAAPRRPVVLFVGTLFNRRRLPDLIAAFARAARTIEGARLVIAGDDRSWPPQDLRAVAAAEGVERQTEFRSYVPDAELAALYAEASVFGFLSEYEGFGLTPLEAMAAGVPPVVLDTPVAREVYGDAAVYVPPDDGHATAEALGALLTSPEARAAVLSHAPGVLARYSWDTAASQTLDRLDALIHPGGFPATHPPGSTPETRPS